MKRFLLLLLFLTMLLSLCACSGGTANNTATVSETVETAAPEEAPQEPEITAEPASQESIVESTPRPEAVLTPGAAEESQMSVQFLPTDDGTLYTSLVRGEGFFSIYDNLPEDVNFVSSFIMTDEGIYASVKETSFFMDPAVLYFFPADGSDRKIITEDLSPSGRFCLAGNEIFFESFVEEGFLWRYDIESGNTACVVPDALSLLTAENGFIYYTKLDGIYRNDSTMAAEEQLFPGGVNALSASEGILCDLTFTNNGTQAVIEFRKPNGDPLLMRDLETITDHFITGRDGSVYIPQGQNILVLSTQDGSEIRTIELPVFESFCTLRYADQNTVIYETIKEGNIAIIQINLEDDSFEVLDTSGIL